MNSIFDFPYLKFILLEWGILVIVFLPFLIIKKEKNNLYISLLGGLGLVSLGFVTGAIMGNNRSEISQTVIPAVFTLLGGIITYFFFQQDKDTGHTPKSKLFIAISNENRTIVSLFLILFPVSLLYGANIGSQFRVQNDEREKASQYNYKLRMDSSEVWKKAEEDTLSTYKYYSQKKYDTWSDNEKARFQKQLNNLKKGDNIPDVPDY